MTMISYPQELECDTPRARYSLTRSKRSFEHNTNDNNIVITFHGITYNVATLPEIFEDEELSQIEFQPYEISRSSSMSSIAFSQCYDEDSFCEQ